MSKKFGSKIRVAQEELYWELDGVPTFGIDGFVQLSLGGVEGSMTGADAEFEGSLKGLLDYTKDWDPATNTVSVFTAGQIPAEEIAAAVEEAGLTLQEAD